MYQPRFRMVLRIIFALAFTAIFVAFPTSFSSRYYRKMTKSSLSLSVSSEVATIKDSIKTPSVTDLDSPRVALLTEISDRPGALYDILRYFWKYEISLTHIESRPSPRNNDGFLIFIDFLGDPAEEKTDKLIKELRANCRDILMLDERQVPWFPRHEGELDRLAPRTLDAASGDLTADHPGFLDPIYRTRRTELAALAQSHRHGQPLPYINYTPAEVTVWGTVYNKLRELQSKYACDEYNSIMSEMEKHCGYSPDRIPQAADISSFLQVRSGFSLRPVAGLLSSRDFLNGLAFRVFFSTQYIRHESRPLYTPEPDICHELLGHAPMFADKDFAAFSQEIGLASLGAADEEITALARCYWHSVEFGLVKDSKTGARRAYGAGLLSSFGELVYSCSDDQTPSSNHAKPAIVPWDPVIAARTPFPITDYQPVYFLADSLSDAKTKMRAFCERLPNKPFYARLNQETGRIWVDRALKVVDSDEKLRSSSSGSSSGNKYE